MCRTVVRFSVIIFCFFTPLSYSAEFCSEKNIKQTKRILNLVFLPLHYQNNSDFFQDLNIITRRLKETKPFDEFNDRIELSYIILSKKEENLIFKSITGFVPFRICQDFLNEISPSFNNHYKLIIIDADGSVSCAELSLIDNISLIILGRNRYGNSDAFSKGFLHEFGHSFGLRDECVDCIPRCPAGPPNCAMTKREAEKWWGDLAVHFSQVDYIYGCCGNNDYIRPTIASLMNDTEKANNYGPVNERYLREALLNFLETAVME